MGSIFLYLAISIVILGLIQVAIFDDIEGWDMVTSIYFIVVTLTTIGYGDYGKIIISTIKAKLFRTNVSKTKAHRHGKSPSTDHHSRIHVST